MTPRLSYVAQAGLAALGALALCLAFALPARAADAVDGAKDGAAGGAKDGAAGGAKNTAHAGAGFDDCAACHTPTGWHEMRKGGVSGFDHGPTGFPLRGRHADTSCTDCHQGRTLRGARCTTCHADVHEARNGDRCDACHTPRDWRLPDALAAHQRTRFPLQGAHLGAPCRDCHRGAATNTWSGVDFRCAACHAEDAKGTHPAHNQPPFTTECEACHSPFGFGTAAVDHGRWWPLSGAHRKADCSACHAGGRYAGTSSACLTCHRDDFRRGHAPTEPDLCYGCHSTTAWKPAIPLRHDRFFPVPHHGVRDCDDCHPTSKTTFTCTGCHTHAKSRTDGHHGGVRGYVYASHNCLRCHPRGGGD